ncbi:MAG TPA: His/Gly/Thr/Pro-type tRNA ligase C-terminal domain-containing protein, partial [Bacteroidia bacterium]|nr:His/Gly/Thr/Pro-type tRNA ligase C-terminal domain-containing protein [Bacteroidia bacterium]
KEGVLDYVWSTSWGVSTRLMGALIMAHSDDQGLVLPPKLAPIQVVIVPIYKTEEQLQEISDAVLKIKKSLEDKGVSVKYDSRDTHRPGWKFAEYEMKGIPIRIAIGGRDMENKTAEIARRDLKTKETIRQDEIEIKIPALLDEIQKNLFLKAKNFKEQMTVEANSYEEFKKILDEKGGFVMAHWDGTPETEQKIKEETKATIRCIPLNNKMEEGKCILTGKPSSQRVMFAKAY